MIPAVIKLIDETLFMIRSKDDSASYFGDIILHKFEFRFFLCLDIIRYELQTSRQISDLTADAMSQLFVFGTFEYYYRDYPLIHDKCSELFSTLVPYNQKLENNDLQGSIGVQSKSWANYFSKVISNII